MKTDGVKVGVEKLTGLFEALAKSRNEIKAECRAVVVGERTRGDSKTCDRVVVSEMKILDALNKVNRRLDNHDAILTNLKTDKVRLVPEPATLTAPTSQWSEVARKPRKPANKQAAGLNTGDSAKPARIMQCSRPLAVIVRRGEEQFPELLRTVRINVDPAKTGTAISKIRQTRTGELLIEINGGAESANLVREEMERSFGPNAKVKTMEDTATVEIRDLDGLTTREEVLDAILASGEA